jgi:crotonobetainyl-CoA:carnitine CoA-transferase CaiB-like acyl-CoA transferase
MNTGWRISNNAQVDAIVSEWTRARTTAEAIAALNAGEVAASPIRDIHDIMAWGHMGERGMLQSVQHPTEALSQRVLGAGFPIKLGRTHKGHVTPAPFLGQHNQEIYGGLLGLPTERIEDLRSRRII